MFLNVNLKNANNILKKYDMIISFVNCTIVSTLILHILFLNKSKSCFSNFNCHLIKLGFLNEILNSLSFND